MKVVRDTTNVTIPSTSVYKTVYNKIRMKITLLSEFLKNIYTTFQISKINRLKRHDANMGIFLVPRALPAKIDHECN